MAHPSIVELTGRIDNLTAADVESSIGSALDATPSALVLDFAEVTFVSSMGLRILLMAAKRCRKQKIQLALHSVSPQIVELFGLSGLNTFFPLYPTREAAVASFA